MAVAELGGHIFTVGGFDDQTQVVAAVDRFNPEDNTWSAVTPLPRPLHHVNLASLDGKLWLLGALEGGGFQAVGVCLAYDPAADTWTPLQDMAAGTERGAAAVGVVGRRILVAGGYRSGSVADASVYLVDENRWESLPALPVPRDHLVGAAVDGHFFAIGGRHGVLEARVDIFDVVTGTWALGSDMPTARAGCSAAVVNGRIIVAGGEGNNAVTTGVFAETEAYAPLTDTWSTLPAMRTPRHGTGAAAVGNALFMPGGATREGFGAVATHEVLLLEP